MATLLSREQILASPVPTRDVEIPEWGGTVRLRALSPRLRVELLDIIHANAREVEDWEADQKLPENDRVGHPKAIYFDQSILTVLFAIIDDKGALVFTMADYDAFSELSMVTISTLWSAARELETPVDPSSLKKSSKSRRSAGSSSASR